MSENTTSKPTSEPKIMQPALRRVDLNLLTIFDTVMQEKSLTRAAQTLGMSQPAVSSAVSRLKVLFKDELFVRNGRGIKPTDRAFQLFSSVRRALQLVQNELPDTLFDPLDCERVYNLCVCSPLDNYLTPLIFNKISEIAPRVSLSFKSSLSQQVINQLRYQEVEFVLDYNKFNHPEFTSIPLFNDEMVLVDRRGHPRITASLDEQEIYREQHATVALDRYASFSHPWYSSEEQQACIAFHGNALVSVLSVVSQTNMVAIAPEWLAREFEEQFALQLLPLPLDMNSRTCYLSWHETAGQERSHRWMAELLTKICQR
ncbi:transcriptional regulator LeuO [Klebsiella spallanzanii]|uniref:transcriptional regulator LeuO n=1 Tax=Klebsiella spallanzanii TaxID=2587528 RepID=UPI001159C850|nr:transcriptional regulator LeuO [Klebsiella spallanzanii]VUS67557.1 HTH-type transcriptional regulator LeuO [Klebsiella spallanzanii]